MDFEFLQDRVKPQAFGSNPMTFLNPIERDAFGLVMEILMIETGGRKSWSSWQRRQVDTLVREIGKRSEFHRDRMNAYVTGKSSLSDLPVQTRKDTVDQVLKEGSLVKATNKVGVCKNSTSGSGGTPVTFYNTSVNNKYQSLRGVAEDLAQGNDYRDNVVRLLPVLAGEGMHEKTYLKAEIKKSIGPLSGLFRLGQRKYIYYRNCLDQLEKELSKFHPHRLASNPSMMDEIIAFGGVELLTELGVRTWVPYAGARDFSQDEIFTSAGIDIRGNYSCQELGIIAYECAHHPGKFHVAVSNVIVELDDGQTAEFEGKTLSRVLVTGLHAYATPFLRYDIGDFAHLENNCPCGHDGPTLSHIFGRAKQFFTTPDGAQVYFNADAKIMNAMVRCQEFRFHQINPETVRVMIGGRDELEASEIESLRQFVANRTSYPFDIELETVPEIDWSGNPKQLAITSAVTP